MCVGMRGVYLLRDPALDHAQHMCALVLGQFLPLRDLVHLLQTSAATRSRRMLCHEDRMIAPRRLLPVIPRKRRRQPLGDELRAVLHHRRQTPRLDVCALASDQFELAPEWGGGEPAKDFVNVDHARSNARHGETIHADGVTTRTAPTPQQRSTSASIFPAIIRKSMR